MMTAYQYLSTESLTNDSVFYQIFRSCLIMNIQLSLVMDRKKKKKQQNVCTCAVEDETSSVWTLTETVLFTPSLLILLALLSDFQKSIQPLFGCFFGGCHGKGKNTPLITMPCRSAVFLLGSLQSLVRNLTEASFDRLTWPVTGRKFPLNTFIEKWMIFFFFWFLGWM